MSVLCSICQDFLTERPQTLTANSELVICTLRCGHLFHHICVQQWFRSAAERAQAAGAAQGIPAHQPNEGNCPCCKKAASFDSAIRVYPTGDEDSNSIVQQKRTLEAAAAENDRLNADLDVANQTIGLMQSDLEEEVVAHDMLKMEYAQALSKIQALQEQQNDNVNIKAALENSLRAELEKLEKEKNEALQSKIAMEEREKKLISEIQLLQLQINDKENIVTSSVNEPGSFRQQGRSKAINVMIKKPDRDETSDGESASGSPTSPPDSPQILPRIVPYSDVDEFNHSDGD